MRWRVPRVCHRRPRIGDQFQNATIQTVVSRVRQVRQLPAAVPLGNFRSAEDNGVSAVQAPGRPGAGVQTPPWLSQVGFLEIYWADIPRELQAKGFIIEESKAWARTIVGRIHARYSRQAKNLPSAQNKNHSPLAIKDDDYLAGADALEDMIETFAVLGNLLWVAEKAGVLKFDLDKLLNHLLRGRAGRGGFCGSTREILAKFKTILGPRRTNRQGRHRAEIYIRRAQRGHSSRLHGDAGSHASPARNCRCRRCPARTPDGSSLMPTRSRPAGLGQPDSRFMTIGSPIDKHLVLCRTCGRRSRRPILPCCPQKTWPQKDEDPVA